MNGGTKCYPLIRGRMNIPKNAHNRCPKDEPAQDEEDEDPSDDNSNGGGCPSRDDDEGFTDNEGNDWEADNQTTANEYHRGEE